MDYKLHTTEYIEILYNKTDGERPAPLYWTQCRTQRNSLEQKSGERQHVFMYIEKIAEPFLLK